MVDAYLSKTCTKCGETKPETEFSFKRKGHPTRYPRCKACVNARSRLYHTTTKARILARKKATREANLETYRARERAMAHQRRAQRLLYIKVWLAANPDKERAARMKRYAAYPEKFRAIGARYRARKNGAPRNDLTAAQWRAIKAHYGHRCVYCGRTMARLTMDHIVPLSQGGAHTLQNVVPACQSCNSRKNDGPVLKPVQPLLLL